MMQRSHEGEGDHPPGGYETPYAGPLGFNIGRQPTQAQPDLQAAEPTGPRQNAPESSNPAASSVASTEARSNKTSASIITDFSKGKENPDLLVDIRYPDRRDDFNLGEIHDAPTTMNKARSNYLMGLMLGSVPPVVTLFYASTRMNTAVSGNIDIGQAVVAGLEIFTSVAAEYALGAYIVGKFQKLSLASQAYKKYLVDLQRSRNDLYQASPQIHET